MTNPKLSLLDVDGNHITFEIRNTMSNWDITTSAETALYEQHLWIEGKDGKYLDFTFTLNSVFPRIINFAGQKLNNDCSQIFHDWLTIWKGKLI